MPDTAKFDHPSQAPLHRESPSGSKTDPFALAKLLNEWMQGDETEQRETFEALCRSWDEDRPEGYRRSSLA
jgi:hypothetical protein